jgi:hypothetical protein
MIVPAPVMFETDFLKAIAARSLLPAPSRGSWTVDFFLSVLTGRLLSVNGVQMTGPSPVGVLVLARSICRVCASGWAQW